MRIYLLIITFVIASRASAGTDIDSVYSKSDLMVSGHVIRHGYAPSLSIGELRYHFDFVIFSMCAETDRYPALLKELLPGDTLKNLYYATGKLSDTVKINQWYMLPLIRDTLSSGGWKLTSEYWSSGIFNDSNLGACDNQINYIFNEYGVVQQKCTFQGRWGVTTLTTLDNTIRERGKYRWHKEKSIEWKMEYSESGKLISKSRRVYKPVGWSSKQVVWIFRANGRATVRRQVWRVVL